MADDAVRVLDAAGIAQACVFGISMGGMIAQELALHYPARVRALVLGATFGSQLGATSPGLGVARDLLLVTLFSRRPGRMARLLGRRVRGRHQDRFVEWLDRLGRPRRSAARRQILAIARHEAEDRLPQAPRSDARHQREPRSPGAGGELAAAGAHDPAGAARGTAGRGARISVRAADETVRAVVEHCLGEVTVAAP